MNTTNTLTGKENNGGDKEKERRDWALLIFILPIGICMMLVAGQFAIRLAPSWMVHGDMNSALNPDTAQQQQAGPIQPVSFDIMTPMSWLDTFLTPNPDEGDGGFSFPPFIVLAPTNTPTLTSTPSSEPSVTPTASASPSPTVTVVTTAPSPTKTNRPTDQPTDTVTVVPTTATTTTTVTPTATTTTPTATTTTPTPTATTTTPTATPTGTPSTLDPASQIPPPPNVNTDVPDGNWDTVPAGNYFVIPGSIVVNVTPDGNYDLAYYETLFGSANIQMDWVIIGISHLSDGSQYYEVFNWGHGGPDMNTNVGDVAASTGTENDNQIIPTTELYDPDGAGSAPQTGILIDVDTASSNPPPGTYEYIVVINPPDNPPPDNTQLDAVVVTEVPISPTP